MRTDEARKDQVAQRGCAEHLQRAAIKRYAQGLVSDDEVGAVARLHRRGRVQQAFEIVLEFRVSIAVAAVVHFAFEVEALHLIAGTGMKIVYDYHFGSG